MYFEDIEPGDKFTSRPRVVTPTDIDTFAITTGAVNPLFLDDKSARKLGFDQRIAPGLLTLSLTVGLVYALGLFDHVIALMHIDVNFLASVNAGDEIKSVVEVVEKRETRHPERGIAILKVTSQNQDGKPVLEIGNLTCLIRHKS